MTNHQTTRREVLKAGVLGAAGLAVAGRPVLAKPSRPIPAKAKSVIQIWMWGGPAHLDTFDPKPDAGDDFTGPLNQPIATSVPGITIGQMLPELARQADKYAILRGMTHNVNAHETASYMVQTGREQGGRIVYPCVGAVVANRMGYDAGYRELIPPYVVLTQPQGRFSEAGFLGNRFKPFATGGDPSKTPFVVEGVVAQGISDQRQRLRRRMLDKLDGLGTALANSPTVRELKARETEAYDLILGEAGQVFDLSTETDELRERYGVNKFGQSCLMARRLVEQGVKYVTINYMGWDTHKQHFPLMRRQLPELDRGLATLLADLSDRGLLDETIVWWGGEFGRTPKVQWEAPWNGGRGHFGQAFSMLLAGGGFRGGQVVGATDAKGMTVTDRPIYPWDLIGTIYRQLGIDPDGEIRHPSGDMVRLTPAKDDGVPTGGRLDEIG
jgi:uncharacterized protein (DUF1501 family)